MRTAVGIFTDRARAERAVSELARLGFGAEHVTLLCPGEHVETDVLPTTEGEAPGMGKAVGATVGTAVGGAAGLHFGAGVLTFLLPGIGPIIASGLIGAAILAAAGYAVGGAVETSLTDGIPRDEAFVYVDALRRGRTVVAVMADDQARADAARSALAAAGAESLDAAREEWWLGLRSAERERYAAAGGDNFDAAEADYRRGFEAAVRVGVPLSPDARETDTFRRGFERGLKYRESLAEIRRHDRAA
ncbi:MAG: hypothetical protein HYR51_04880 [Candidatus Rokubacteria bacterium]|nr:hypothetical protein [Candidatus Rokubacteria bacterium]